MNKALGILTVIILWGFNSSKNSDEAPYLPTGNLISTNNDTASLAELLALHPTIYLVVYKSPYCHSCLPEVIQILERKRKVRQALYVAYANQVPLSHRELALSLENENLKLNPNRLYRYENLDFTSNRGFLFLYVLRGNSPPEVYSYQQITAPNFSPY